MGDLLTIRLEVYLPFRGQRIWRGEERVAAGSTVAELIAALSLAEPDLAVLMNGRHAPDQTVLSDGDEVAVLRHSEGG
ncbi:MAG TPA: MoaD/ThiS family protein [Symbiobacteriaceae bacterium]|nr:MoaD/ThiS family protein [Symbiobacteriaceae bacterium]